MQVIEITIVKSSPEPYCWSDNQEQETAITADSWRGMIEDLIGEHTMSCRNDGNVTATVITDVGHARIERSSR